MLPSEILKQGTAVLHKRLEQAPVSQAISSHSITLEKYLEYLQAFYRLHSSVEERVFPVVSGIIDTSARSKISALSADIQCLEHKPDNCVIFSWPDDVDLCFALGAMYVTEGSTLGGMFLHKHICGQLPDAPSSYLTIYGKSTAAYWRQFLDALNAYAEEKGAGGVEKMVNGANFVFSAALELFQTPIVNDLQKHS